VQLECGLLDGGVRYGRIRKQNAVSEFGLFDRAEGAVVAAAAVVRSSSSSGSSRSALADEVPEALPCATSGVVGASVLVGCSERAEREAPLVRAVEQESGEVASARGSASSVLTAALCVGCVARHGGGVCERARQPGDSKNLASEAFCGQRESELFLRLNSSDSRWGELGRASIEFSSMTFVDQLGVGRRN
jgi:hypothetical protein